MDYAVYFLISAIGALLVGMIGTGSSLVVLPSLALLFSVSLDGHDTLRLAAGTTMATMSTAAIAGALSQYRAGNVDTTLLRMMLPPYVLGALSGPWISRFMPTGALEIYLAAIIGFAAIRMLMASRAKATAEREYASHQFEIFLVLLTIGVCSSVAGIASGLFAIPYLTRFSLSIRAIIGTSTAAAAVYAVCGATGYVAAGISASGLPDESLGYVYVPAFLVMAVTGVIFAPLGVRLARHINEEILRRLLAAFLLFAAIAIVWF